MLSYTPFKIAAILIAALAICTPASTLAHDDLGGCSGTLKLPNAGGLTAREQVIVSRFGIRLGYQRFDGRGYLTYDSTVDNVAGQSETSVAKLWYERNHSEALIKKVDTRAVDSGVIIDLRHYELDANGCVVYSKKLALYGSKHCASMIVSQIISDTSSLRSLFDRIVRIADSMRFNLSGISKQLSPVAHPRITAPLTDQNLFAVEQFILGRNREQLSSVFFRLPSAEAITTCFEGANDKLISRQLSKFSYGPADDPYYSGNTFRYSNGDSGILKIAEFEGNTLYSVIDARTGRYLYCCKVYEGLQGRRQLYIYRIRYVPHGLHISEYHLSKSKVDIKKQVDFERGYISKQARYIEALYKSLDSSANGFGLTSSITISVGRSTCRRREVIHCDIVNPMDPDHSGRLEYTFNKGKLCTVTTNANDGVLSTVKYIYRHSR